MTDRRKSAFLPHVSRSSSFGFSIIFKDPSPTGTGAVGVGAICDRCAAGITNHNVELDVGGWRVSEYN